MFGLFKSKPASNEPVDIVGEIQIDRPVAEVYSMMDWASQTNAKRALGWAINPVEGEDALFDVVMPFMDELTLHMRITEGLPGEVYAFDCAMSPQMGNLVKSHERNELEALSDTSCHMTLTTTAQFANGLSAREFENEVTMMAAAVQSSLKKFKLQAEHGVEVAKAMEEDILL